MTTPKNFPPPKPLLLQPSLVTKHQGHHPHHLNQTPTVLAVLQNNKGQHSIPFFSASTARNNVFHPPRPSSARPPPPPPVSPAFPPPDPLPSDPSPRELPLTIHFQYLLRPRLRPELCRRLGPRGGNLPRVPLANRQPQLVPPIRRHPRGALLVQG